nr:MAG TPA: hypothetical protein [Caudoviricetes sp.]
MLQIQSKHKYKTQSKVLIMLAVELGQLRIR